MKPILEIQNIGKKFKIQHEHLPYLSLRDSLKQVFKKSRSTEDFWALQDVSFDVMPGDSIGIIGKNGAGKSTLLKILSKITPPTKGQIIGRGRIASLLEVGTGFHPELSGRENIFMNGSILGMKRFEIAKNFDAIVDFSGVERFLDEPLKHYSSGMQLRLAFAVAAFLENEILIIDEVLAVGDAEFQKKCMGKMDDVSKSGRTILFVSHNMGILQNLCKKAILLENGALTFQGESSLAIKNYLSRNIQNEDNNSAVIIQLLQLHDDVIKIDSIKLFQNESNLITDSFDVREMINVELKYTVKKKVNGLRVGFDLKTYDEQLIFRTFHDDNSKHMSLLEVGEYKSIMKIPSHFLSPKYYKLYLSIGIHNVRWIIHDKYYIELKTNEVLGFNYAYGFIHEGIIMPQINWVNTKA
jgi:lipopolysaccharide transport system ATP-binding protein